MKLTETFYERTDVVKIARELLGKTLFTYVDNVITGGMIVETEAYSWQEKGCHAYGMKKTTRNNIMFQNGGHAYVYLCYGMHYLFNVVTNRMEMPEAVLIRAVEPKIGVEMMQLRRPLSKNSYQLTSGPGKLTKALGIDKNLNGKCLWQSEVWIEDSGLKIPASKILASERIGIDYAGEDAKLLWRFSIKDNLWVSR